MAPKYVFEELASRVEAIRNCVASGNSEWELKHKATVRQIVADFLPSGAGWDNGTGFEFSSSHADKLVFYGAFHHMDDAGYYDGWTEHTVTVTPAFVGRYHIRISGRDRNEIKDYIHEIFDVALATRIEWDSDREKYVEAKEV